MPVAKGQKLTGKLGALNRELKQEIRTGFTGKALDDFRRQADSIVTTANFHVDSKQFPGQPGAFKVDIQYKKASNLGKQKGLTVIVIKIEANANNNADLLTAVNEALKDNDYMQVIS